MPPAPLPPPLPSMASGRDLAAVPLPCRRKGAGRKTSPQGRAAREARGGENREHEKNLTVGLGVEWQGFAVAGACDFIGPFLLAACLGGFH